MAVTRINNNQITDASGANTQLGINANTKVQNYSVTSLKLANSFTYGSDFTITGNLQVNGNTTTIDTTTLTVEDPLILLAAGQTGAPSVDIGLVGQRGTSNNVAMVWDESQGTFVTVFTDSTANATTINILSYADFKANDLNVVGNLIANNVSFTGNVTTLTVTGNTTAGNVFSNGIISATGTANVGNLVTNGIISATGTANVGNVETPGYITATGNITGGNIATGNVSTTGNILTDGFISAVGNITANVGSFFIGNGSQLTGLPAGSFIANGTSNINIATADGDITMAVSGQGSVVVINPTGLGATNLSTIGNVSAQGNVSANTLFSTALTSTRVPYVGTSNQLADSTNLTWDNANQVLSVGAGGVQIGGDAGFGAVSAQRLLGTTLSLSGNVVSPLNVPGNTISGGNVTTDGLISATANITGGNLITGGLVTSTGNIQGGNVITAGEVTAQGNVTGGNVSSNGIISAAGTANVGNVLTGGFVTAVGNIHGGNILTAGLISATGNVTSAANVNANNVSVTNDITAVNASLTGNIVIDADATVTGNLTTSFITNSGNAGLTIYANAGLTLSAVGSINASSLNITDVADPVNDQDAATKAYVDAAAQGLVVHPTSNVATTGNVASLTNFTSVAYVQPNGVGNGVGATLTIDSTAQLSIDGINLSTLVAGSGRVLIKNETGSTLTSNAAWNGIYNVTSSGSSQTVLTRADDFDGSPGGEIPSAYTFVNGGTTNANSGWVCTNTTNPTMGTTAINFTQFSQAGNYTAGSGLTLTGSTFSVNTDNVTTTITSGNVVVKASATFVTPNIGNATFDSLSAVGGTGNIIANNVSSVGVVSGVNLIASGNLSATGYVSAGNAYVTSLANTAVPYANATGGLQSSATFTYDAGLLSVGNVATTGNVSSAGNVTAANFVTSGSSGNITGANIISATTFTASGNVTGGNVLTAGIVSATGNVYGNYFIGDGSQLTNLSAGSSLVNGNSNVTVAANSNVTIGITGTSNVIVVSTAGLETSGNLSATGNVTGGNVIVTNNVSVGGNVATTGFVSAGGNVTGGNIISGGFADITGNIAGGNLRTAGSVTATGNVTAGNVVTAGEVSATGNVQAGNIVTAGSITATGNIATAGYLTATGNITGSDLFTAGVVSATGNATAGNILTAGYVSATGNVTSNATINGNAANITNNILAGSLSVTGDVYAGNVLFVDTSTNTASFGSSTQTTNAIVAFNSTNSILLPVGTQGQRPATGVTGMVRWSTTAGAMEAYDGADWATVGAQSFTVIQNEQFNGDGTTTAFTLSSTQTTDSCIVTINGVVQIPTTAYSVSGTSLLFTEAPALGDTIDVRELTTTTTITGITSPTISLVGNVVTTLAASATTITANSAMTFSLASDTSLLISVKGTDGTVRTAAITLS